MFPAAPLWVRWGRTRRSIPSASNAATISDPVGSASVNRPGRYLPKQRLLRAVRNPPERRAFHGAL